MSAARAADDLPWWRSSVGYQVYIRSFADGSGDGVGDLPGILDRLDHLAWLGVDLCWITPFYPSPMHDHGYDVADYTGVDATFGTLDDFDAVLAKARDLGIRVLIDLVPNHSSSAHPWFVSARTSPESPHRHWYIWRDGPADGAPPNNWASHFGGAAWTRDEASGEWWCHLFLPEQPDLNWEHPAVGEAFDGILRFWLDRGVDGFRIDVAHALVKHADLPDNPPAATPEPEEGPVELSDFRKLAHVYDVDQPGVVDIYRHWRPMAEQYGAMLLGEVYLLEPERLTRYVADQDGLHVTFFFGLLHTDWDPDRLRSTLRDAVAACGEHVAWVQSNHDAPRAPTRFGGGRRGRERALALATLLFGLPGIPFVYQGEELGLTDGAVAPEQAQDPIGARAHDLEHSRDGCRTPMVWEPGPGWGFTSAGTTWLPFGDRRPQDTVAVQRDDPTSTLHRYRALVRLRRAEPELHAAPLTWLPDTGTVVAFRRRHLVVAANVGDRSARLDVGVGTVLFATSPERDGAHVDEAVDLAPREAVIVRLAAEELSR